MHLLVGREKEQEFLISLLSNNHPLSNCFVITGPPGCGKSILITSTCKILEQSYGINWISISCLETAKGAHATCGSSSKHFFELILQSIKCKYLPKDNILKTNCDGTASFLSNLANLLRALSVNEGQVCFGIVFEQVEKLFDADTFLLPLITNLGSLMDEQMQESISTGHSCKLFTVLITRLPWEKFNSGTFYLEPFVITIDSYSREQLARLLTSLSPKNTSAVRFTRFIDLLLTVCFPVCRNAGELIHLMNVNWPAFEEPVVKGLVAPDDEWGQWKLAQPFLKKSLTTMYLRQNSQFNQTWKTSENVRTCSEFLELPYLTRFLVIAAFMASYNPRASDKKLLVKNTGKLSMRQKKHEKEIKKTQTQLTGPRLFPLDRLLAIFYSLIQDDRSRIPFTGLLTSQIACLTALGILASSNNSTSVGGNSLSSGLSLISNNVTGLSDSDSLANPKYRCLISFELAKSIALSVDFDLLAHLTEFSPV